MAAIDIRGLRRAFGELVAVDDLSLHIGEGEIYGLVGPDGSGKTTIMRLLCGALRLDDGEVTIAGRDLAHDPERVRDAIGYLPQAFSLYGELTVMENLRFFAEVRGLSAKDWLPRARQVLEFVGLEAFADRRADALSGGMKQKLGLAAALVHRPRVLLLDEPTGGVDPVTRQAFWQLLIRLAGEGTAALISTPYMDEASRCSRVGFLSRGRLLVEGSPAQLTAALEGCIVELSGGPRWLIEALAADDPAVEDVQTFGDRFHLRTLPNSAGDVIERWSRTVPDRQGRLTGIRLAQPTLEDAFIYRLQVANG
jgi:ABC-2 type transport system ATP-binding protein